MPETHAGIVETAAHGPDMRHDTVSRCQLFKRWLDRRISEQPLPPISRAREEAGSESVPMKRLTISLDDDLADAFEALVRARGYENRSEAFRDLLRQDLGTARIDEQPEGPCVGTLSYVYNHHQRQLAMRLNQLQHDHHELTVATTHAHLDHDRCIETVIVRGPTAAVRDFAQSVIAQPGVSHGQLHLVPLEAGPPHSHEHHHPHD